jgi:putative phosphoesterase
LRSSYCDFKTASSLSTSSAESITRLVISSGFRYSFPNPAAHADPMMKAITIGLISDTHGLLRASAIEALRGSDFIIHAGDIGDPGILRRLAELAPLTAIRGNNDVGAEYANVPERAWLHASGVRIYVLHNLQELNPALDWNRSEHPVHVVVSGHSHKPGCERRAGVLYVNPGSSGPRRFRLPIALARLRINASGIEAQPIELSE